MKLNLVALPHIVGLLLWALTLASGRVPQKSNSTNLLATTVQGGLNWVESISAAPPPADVTAQSSGFDVAASIFQSNEPQSPPARKDYGTQDVSSDAAIQQRWAQLSHRLAVYNYEEALFLSNVFYEAQRSGYFAPSLNVPWRGNSCLDDQATHNGLNYTQIGGWYDGGDGLKLTFPLGSTVAILAWGMLQFAEGYNTAGQMAYAQTNLRWAADWLKQTHVADFNIVAQVGSAYLDHELFWVPPEGISVARPALVLNSSTNCADLLSSVAAGLAATSLVFRASDAGYSQDLLSQAMQLYKWARNSEGLYSDWTPDKLYVSSGYLDDLAWAAAWLYYATGNATYMSDAETYYNRNEIEGQGHDYPVFNWDNMIWGVDTLLVSLSTPAAPTPIVHYQAMETMMSVWNTGDSIINYTSKGLASSDDWGSLRNTANTAFLANIFSRYATNPKLAAQHRCWALSQTRYALGDSGRSFVVGFGIDPPTHEHHRGASCPAYPAPCGWSYYSTPDPNPNTLYGALVGGPGGGSDDSYQDVRSAFETNEVACDYNAGFQGVLAAMLMPGAMSWDTCIAMYRSPSPPPPSPPSPPAPPPPSPLPPQPPAGNALESGTLDSLQTNQQQRSAAAPSAARRWVVQTAVAVLPLILRFI